MEMNIVVLVKQVPDTRFGGGSMNADGTINRAGLPAVFNPDDLNALEQALLLKDVNPGSRVTVMTMGPGRAADILREALYRGADEAIILTDRAFAGADTLATSYVLSAAVRKVGAFDVVLCGRQAIDGDTAQVGPQVAQLLGIPQVTCVRRILSSGGGTIVAERAVDNGTEVVKAPLPLLLTVDGTAAPCRPRNAYRMLRFHRAATPTEMSGDGFRYAAMHSADAVLAIKEWNLEYLGRDASCCGLSGSPTRVKEVSDIAFGIKENKRYTAADEDIRALLSELAGKHVIG